jgi:anti-sigma factor RsiW
MACESWREKIDAYADGELSSAEANDFAVHLRQCPDCAADTLERVQMKRALAMAGKRYEASAEFRAQIQRSIAARPSGSRSRSWLWILAAPVALVLILSLAVNLYVGRQEARQARVYGELADLHVATLASANPVDVISTDRHTVKPWFEGKIPFTFNLPELQNTDFTLVGGRVTYLGQMPGAQLIYRIRKHEISVFIFQDRGGDAASLPSGVMPAFSFNVKCWTKNGLRYFVVGDVGSNDIEALTKLLRDAG